MIAPLKQHNLIQFDASNDACPIEIAEFGTQNNECPIEIEKNGDLFSVIQTDDVQTGARF